MNNKKYLRQIFPCHTEAGNENWTNIIIKDTYEDKRLIYYSFISYHTEIFRIMCDMDVDYNDKQYSWVNYVDLALFLKFIMGKKEYNRYLNSLDTPYCETTSATTTHYFMSILKKYEVVDKAFTNLMEEFLSYANMLQGAYMKNETTTYNRIANTVDNMIEFYTGKDYQIERKL